MSKNNKAGKKLNNFEHVLKRPDMYIGSVITSPKETWVFSQDPTEEEVEDEEGKKSTITLPSIVKELVDYNDGLVRIFIETMSNAIDNKWRSDEHDIKMSKIEFTIVNDPESLDHGRITILNDGYYIPVVGTEYVEKNGSLYPITEDEEGNRFYNETEEVTDKLKIIKKYPAELFFGEMFAGTNFEQDDNRKTSGRNGVGSKAAVIFSKEFVIEHTDPVEQKMFTQIRRHNGTECEKPSIKSFKNKNGYTKISFLPDYAYFGFEGMNDTLFSIFKRFVYECAMVTGLNVKLNGETIPTKDLLKYSKLYYPSSKSLLLSAPNGDSCVVIETDTDITESASPSHMSWINGIYTRDGGVHLQPWVDVIFQTFVRLFNQKRKADELKVSAREVYPHLMIFVRSETYNAKFDGQTKDKCVAPEISLYGKEDKNKFTGDINVAVTKMLKWNFVKNIEDNLYAKSETQLKKKEKAKFSSSQYPKLIDANWAGKKPEKCTITFTEGDSALTLARAFIKARGHDVHGAFPLKGKPINARSHTKKKVLENEEIKAIMAITGLKYGVDYSIPENRKELRYGRFNVLSDQDDDGLHIRGLMINLIETYWPSLLSATDDEGNPIVISESTAVVTLKNKKGSLINIFYTFPEYQKYSLEHPEEIKKNVIKYYKGLGSHEPGESNMYVNDPKILYFKDDAEDRKYMDMAFGKANNGANLRKKWIQRDQLEINPARSEGIITLKEYVNDWLIIFARRTIWRAIPNIYDGFKISQRKCFYGALTHTATKNQTPVKVASLGGYITEKLAYHHGPVSLEGTIVNLAQGFVGTNNIPLLHNGGQFGTRDQGGKDASWSRYISTYLNEISKYIFRDEDLPILEKNIEEGEEIEPVFLMPIIPMLLVNGAEGIATGYSTKIPCYNPEDLIDWIEAWLSSEDRTVEREPLVPWYRLFTGDIKLTKNNDGVVTGWKSYGKMTSKGGIYEITELPIGLWTCKMYEYLLKLQEGDNSGKVKKPKSITGVKQCHPCTNKVHFKFKPTKDFIPDMTVRGNFDILVSSKSLRNMTVIDELGNPRKYESPEDILQVFCQKRLEYYTKRKDYWLGVLDHQYEKAENKLRFVKNIIDKKININLDDESLEALLKKNNYKMFDGDYNYLLSMPIGTMTVKKMDNLKKEMENIKQKRDSLSEKSEEDLWREDLKELKVEYKKFLKKRNEHDNKD